MTPEEKEYAAKKKAVDDAVIERDNSYQNMFKERRKALEEQRSNNLRIAKFNAIGNALRTMVQPIGWAAGGSTAGVQPYDNRQYIDSFNRAVRDSDNIRNLGTQEQEYQFRLSNEKVKDARRELENLEEVQRQNNLIQARADAQKSVEQARNEGKLADYYRKNIADAFKSYNALIQSNNIHKSGIMSFKDYLWKDGAGVAAYGNEIFNLTDQQLRDIAEGNDATAASSVGEQPRVTAPGTVATAGTTAATTTKPKSSASKISLSADEQNTISTLQPYDKDNDGKLSEQERRRGLFQWGKPKIDESTAEAYAKAVAKQRKIEGKPKTEAPKQENKPAKEKENNKKDKPAKKTARDIMK